MTENAVNKAPARKKVTLSVADRETAEAVELISICQTVTQDGSLSEAEINELRNWLEGNRDSQLPAISFLIETVEKILADGLVTEDEQKELYKAIERVLPADLRCAVVQHRKDLEAEEKRRTRTVQQKKKDAELEQKKAAAAERQKNRPVDSSNFMVAGVRYDGRAEVIERYVDSGDVVFLVRDRENRHSRNAIEVRLENGMQIGFMPEIEAKVLARLLDEGCPHRAYITKVLTGGRAPIPVVQAYFYDQDASIEGLAYERDSQDGIMTGTPIPPKRHPGEISPFTAAAILAVLAFIVIAVLMSR